jgi:hypothetical protein
MTSHDEQEIAELIGMLPPAPAAWVSAARELPRTERELKQVLPQIEGEAASRAKDTKALEAAIEAAGLEARPELVNELRRRLASRG